MVLILRILLGREMWYYQTKQAAVKVLAAAHTTNELAAATGSYGLFLPLNHGGWITIHYQDTHAGGVWSCAVALDSGGGWFESDYHFCGGLRGWPRMKEFAAEELEQREMNMDWFSTRPSARTQTFFREMEAIESAPDLPSTRRALEKIGFKAFQP
jgi:hypothetical protein